MSATRPPSEFSKIERGIAYLEKCGFRVVTGDSVAAKDGYLSGTDEIRAADIHRMFEDDGIAAVFCTRGGYGCTRLLPLLDYALIRRGCKPFIGFSDITALHCAFLANAGIMSKRVTISSMSTYAILGCGSVGHAVAEELVDQGKDVLIIDRDEGRVDGREGRLGDGDLVGAHRRPHQARREGVVALDTLGV